MGNRAVITTQEYLTNPDTIGVYLHWNGGRDSVQAFLLYCKLKGYRPPDEDCYGWARLCQVVGNYFGGGLSIGIDACARLDCDNWDNGVYITEGWEIVGRRFAPEEEEQDRDLLEMLRKINRAQPPKEQLPDEDLQKAVEEFRNPLPF